MRQMLQKSTLVLRWESQARAALQLLTRLTLERMIFKAVRLLPISCAPNARILGPTA